MIDDFLSINTNFIACLLNEVRFSTSFTTTSEKIGKLFFVKELKPISLSIWSIILDHEKSWMSHGFGWR